MNLSRGGCWLLSYSEFTNQMDRTRYHEDIPTECSIRGICHVALELLVDAGGHVLRVIDRFLMAARPGSELGVEEQCCTTKGRQ